MIPRIEWWLFGQSQPFRVLVPADPNALKWRYPVSSLLKKKSRIANHLLKAGIQISRRGR
ncbi:hypothetical protein [Burkholderia lata]|uniref:hypothetical protein n=1 Tax=Burkholderia lata (strain ATCC 17760 / DSM 23089 / LMG 22485 / NCIMB 9086 / R18194 / 383) TaxID=482957 RepID=UPI0015815EFE|nr:hypothetical protein [Burkholderia lata]